MNYRTHTRLAVAFFGLPMLAALLQGQTRQSLSEAEDRTFYFHGSIDQTLEVEMILTRHGKLIDGSYVYASHRKSLSLKGEMMTPAQYQLEESGPQGDVTGHFTLNELGGPGRLGGTWESADRNRKLPVVLGQITPQQHQLLQKIWDTKPQIVFLAVGPYHSCVLRTLGASCWGEFVLMPSLGTRGPGMVAHRALPNLLIDDTILAVATASRKLCVLQSSSLRCAQPYDPKFSLPELTLIPGFERGATMIGVNQGYSCAAVSGALKCWDGSSLSASSVTEIIPSGVVQLSSGDPQCAVLSSGGLKCWSIEYQQQEKRSKLVVQDISGLKGAIRSLSAAGYDEQHFACAVDSEGLKCWGNNFAQPMGRRPGGVRNLPPAPIAGLETGVTFVSTELNHSCAVKDGKVYCWGSLNFLGELGDATPQALGEPVEVHGIEKATQVAVGPGYSCALTQDDRVFCWGDNELGQTGNVSHDICKVPNGSFDAIDTTCNRHPVEVRGL